MILPLFVPLFWSAACMLAAAPLAIWLARRLKLIDVPFSAPHKTHDHPVPRAGGIALVLVVGLVSLVGWRSLAPGVPAILLSSLFVFAFGIWDDARGLSAPVKLVGQVLGTAFLVWQGISIHFAGQPALDIALTFLWVIGITNAFNFVDSMDGLALGLAAIASAFFMLVTLDAAQQALAFLSATLLGACIGLAWFNILPARAFLGDSGAQWLGFTLAALAIAYTPPGLPQPSSWFVPILLLAIPIFDMLLVVSARLLQRTPVYRGALDHTYHRLVKVGMGPAHAVVSMHLAAILSGCLAFMALPQPPLWANLIFAGAVLAGLVGLVWLRKRTD